MTFEDYLKEKRIDASEFRKQELSVFEEWSGLFGLLSPVSFTAQKLYLINPIRRKYPLKEIAKKEGPSAAPRPVFKPKIK